MQVYFVRHGESEFNRKDPPRFQYPNTPLSDHGKLQAKKIARRFSHIPLQAIITSTFKRARDTAKEIEKVHAEKFVESNLLIERKMPSEFLGKAINDPQVIPVHDKLRSNFGKKDYHYSDEESFDELVKRAQKALKLITSQSAEVAAVVTHGQFLQLLVYCMLFENPEVKPFVSFKHRTEYSNTGLTLCEYSEGEWKLITWNDLTHLGE